MSNKPDHLCRSRGCHNLRAKNRRFSKKTEKYYICVRKYCGKCQSRINREKYPLQFAYWQLKSNAKQRSVPFILTLEEFKMFCEKTNYLELRGRTSKGYAVDRIDINKGYQADNIQLLSIQHNSAKANAEYARSKRYNLPFEYTLHKSVAPEFSDDPTNSNYVPF